MILAAVAVGCPSNGCSASSISDILASAARTTAGGTACYRLSWPAVLPRRLHRPTLLPNAVQAIPLLTNTSCSSPATAASHRSQTSEPSYSPPRGHPLLCLRRLRVVPFLGLAIVHRVGSLGAAWSTLSTNESHRKRHVRGVADSRDPHGPWPHASKSLLLIRNQI